MSRSCVCGGSNLSCRWCGGNGIVEDNLADAVARRSYRPGSASVPPTALPIEIPAKQTLPTSGDCPVCGKKNIKRLHRPVRKVHGRRQSGEAEE
jgi:hypothetical protein